MTSQFLSILAAAGLATSGVASVGDTRSAQSLPAQNLAVAHSAAPTGKQAPVQRVSRLADGNGNGDQGHCVHEERLVDAMHPRCARGGAWGTPLAFGLGAAAIAGVVVAASSGHHHNGNGSSVSN